MAKNKREKQRIDSEIISFLMLSDDMKTAKSIALEIGLNKAKDVSYRLNSLYEKKVIDKVKVNNNVFWTIEQPSIEYESSLCQAITPDDSSVHLKSNVAKSGGYEKLIKIVDELRLEVQSLKNQVEEMQNKQNMDNGTPLPQLMTATPPVYAQHVTSAVPYSTKQQTQDLNSWSPIPSTISKTKHPVHKTTENVIDDSSTILNPNWPSQNRFASLAYVNNWCNDDCLGDCAISSIVQQSCEDDSPEKLFC